MVPVIWETDNWPKAIPSRPVHILPKVKICKITHKNIG